jgi:hypothetical protein
MGTWISQTLYKRILFGFGFIIFCAAYLPAWQSSVLASEQFETSLDTSYLVSESGLTTVKHVIELKNNKPTVYAKQYGLKVSSPNIKNVQVKSNGQVITPALANTENQTSIGITFPDTLVGEGKVRRLEVSYQDPDAAVVSGKVLEVLVPKIANADEYDRYSLTLNTPASYGQPNRVTPSNFSTQQLDDRLLTNFVIERGEGVVALFGTEQVFNLELRYFLENAGSNTGIAQIALPPDTLHQRVWYEQLEPRPQTINRDKDGNWIATYQVPPQQTIEVMALARVLTTLDAFLTPSLDQTQTFLTRTQDFWPTQDPQITALVDEHKNPREMYNFVVNALTYNYQALETDVPRLGAVEALANPDLATCQEYTDLFVTMARAADIPARRITGYAYTQNNLLRPLEVNSDILHAWPEYYDVQLQQWRQVDPTWGNTTGGVNYFDQFDLNHIAFAINGESSTLPYPAGSYKASHQIESKDVKVTFAQDFPDTTPHVSITLEPAMRFGVPVPGDYLLKITNQEGRAWYNMVVSATSDQAIASLPQDIAIPELLPFETETVSLQIFGNQLWKGPRSDLQLNIRYVDPKTEGQTQQLKLNPLTIHEGGQVARIFSLPVTIPLLVIGSISLALIAGSLLVRGRK